ncbi:hypothetical protein Bbelb_280640 [Branchiostoma belcheri]|nr:hypothetical protein Bbelb_280640 [Branchiostoma belcheri]
MDSMGGGNVSKDDFEVLILGRPVVAESDGSAGVNQAQTEGQERGDAPEMNGPMSPGQVETWAETSDEKRYTGSVSGTRHASRPAERRSRWKPTSSIVFLGLHDIDRPHPSIPSLLTRRLRLKAFKVRAGPSYALRKIMERGNDNSRGARHVGENLVVDEATFSRDSKVGEKTEDVSTCATCLPGCVSGPRVSDLFWASSLSVRTLSIAATKGCVRGNNQ